MKIAIIGAGASGLAAARVFSRNGLEPLVLEQNAYSGGVWKYRKGGGGGEASPSPSLSTTTATSKFSPMYKGLRTNLPKEIMAFREFPFPKMNDNSSSSSSSSSNSRNSDDDPSFVTHAAVQDYLLAYQSHFDLTKYIHYESQVQSLQVLKDAKSAASPCNLDEVWPRVQLEWTTSNNQRQETKVDVFDMVCVCNGHYSKPAFANILGLKEYFKGNTMHSVMYDTPNEFQGQRVLCVGGRASGSDLAREISAVAQHVYLSDSTFQLQPGQVPETQGSVTNVPSTQQVLSDGSIQFENCTTLTPQVDCIIFCTGYDYEFPFIQDHNEAAADDDDDDYGIIQNVPGERRIRPLYEQLWHARFPTLAFLGIPHSVVPFPEVEFQAEAVHAQLDNNRLPPLETRLAAAERDAHAGGAKGNGRIQDTHYLGSAQWDYCRRMAKLAGVFDEGVDNYIATNQAIYEHSWEGRKGAFAAGPDTYRDVDYRRDDRHRTFTCKSLAAK